MPEKTEIINYYNGMLSYFADYKKAIPYRLVNVLKSLKELVKPYQKVLDLGCSIGITSNAMAEIGAEVTAVDIAPDLIKYAIEHNYHTNVKYIVSDAAYLDLDEVFDIISIIDLFEHLPKESIKYFMFKLYQWSKFSTVIYINMPHIYAQQYYGKKKVGQQIIENEYYPHQIINLFKDNRFILNSFSVYGDYTEYKFMLLQDIE
uniref:Putative methyltransferase n=3 Tax=viral metagenome TaxID=1070528 RepID=A0A6M3J8I7_9ZZZZ